MRITKSGVRVLSLADTSPPRATHRVDLRFRSEDIDRLARLASLWEVTRTQVLRRLLREGAARYAKS